MKCEKAMRPTAHAGKVAMSENASSGEVAQTRGCATTSPTSSVLVANTIVIASKICT